ncbi:PAS domain S-box protein [Novipirellula artificiosorum]|uniref:Sensor protein FixL n=1 Tax=Novipirellula artificiosorum TaxID=2528016 RepID=A0A5C6DTG0_9BACT|nr:PAS domain S-box protein [Novipirellula artificiosorum]TWU38316.1 Sensor protein FixL [Novipirellula artificiosorum]
MAKKKKNRTDTQSNTKNPEADSVADCFPIVGIGASAGGLAAFKQFLKPMPADNGMAFVLIPHLDPTHESLMVELLSTQTSMPVVEAEDGMTVEVNRVYVIPPNRFLTISHGVLQLIDPPERGGWQTAIDCFLKSLAADQRERAIGIVLSGTGSHGTPGIREIKLMGGMVVVQSPESAEYNQMPLSAIATGLPDCVLPPDQMATALVKYIAQPYLKRSQKMLASSQEEAEQLARVLNVLRTRSKYDFRNYRKAMILRRVLRRMGLCHIAKLDDYLALLRDRPEEVTALYKDLLIGVTAFFRDPEAFEVLEKEVIPAMIARQTGEFPIRVWVPSCATGEEAYSIAMLFFEGFAANDIPCNVQIFASDIDEDSIEVARSGIYPKSIAIDVSAERLKRFFVKVDDQRFQINKRLRESIVFSQQNLISDPPFSKLHLISCRNFLIYLEPQIQQKLIALFHFALAEDGHLLLGPSETIGRAVDMFVTVSKKWRLFRRIGPQRRDLIEIPLVRRQDRLREVAHHPATSGQRKSFKELAEKLILSEFAPATVLINRRFEILYVAGPLVDYLEFPMGELSKDLLAMARSGLRTKIRAICNQSIRSNEPVADCCARVKRNGGYVHCTIAVRPLTEPKQAEGLMLVTFEDLRPDPVQTSGDALNSPVPNEDQSTGMRSVFVDETPLVQQLELELKSTREDLQSTIEEMESANEELKASNEEIMSMNEELQSANEELETSKEELQSLNEELSTVNNQLVDKVSELDKTNADITNLMASTDIATIFLNNDLQIERFTPPVIPLFNLLPTDVGRPLADIAHPFSDRSMHQECQQVLTNLAPMVREVQTDSSQSYLRRILPYRTGDNRIGGVVITFLDLTDRVVAERQSRLLSIALHDSNDAVTMQAMDGRITSWNRGAEKMYGYSESEAMTMNACDLVPDGQMDATLAAIHRISAGESSESFETRHRAKDGRILDVSMTVSKGEDAAETTVVATHRDVTERNRLERQLQESEKRMRAILETAPDAIVTINHQGIIDSINPATEKMFGYRDDEIVGQNVSMLMLPPLRDEHDGYLQRFLETRERRMIGNRREVTAVRKDGSTFHVDLSISQVDRLDLFTGVMRDITARKNLESHVLEIATNEQRRIGQELHDGTQQELTALSLFAGTMVSVLSSASRQVPQSNQDKGPVSWILEDRVFVQIQEAASRLANGLSEASRHVHELSHGILPVQLDSEGLRSALIDLAEATDLQQTVSCSFDCSGAIAVANTTVATQLYRIAQEALSNAVRHGSASEIRISLVRKLDALVLEVSDNGRGFDAIVPNQYASATSGMGLRIMDYRANSIGGVLRFRRGEDGGTIVQCTVPIGALSAV